MFKLDLEKAVEPEIKLPTPAGSLKKQENSRKTSTSSSLTKLEPLTVWITTNWKILQKIGIPDHLICLLRNLYAGQEATIRTGRGTMDLFCNWKRSTSRLYISPCLFNLYAESMWNAGLDEAQLESRLPGEISITSDMQMTLMAESKEEPRSLLMKLKEESKKAGIKFNIQ